MMSSTSIKKVRFLIGISLLLVTGIPGFFLPAEDKIDPECWNKAEKIHREAIVIDTHCDTPMVLSHRKLDLGQQTDKNEVDFIRMKQGGLDAMFFAVFVSNRLDDSHPAKNALEMIDEIFLQVEKYPGLAQMAFSPQDIRDIHRQGKRAILIGIENGGAIEQSPGILRNFYRLGVRYITLTHNSNNAICDSAVDEKPKWNGLSPFGKEVVREMNRLGMLIDVSHISDQAFWDVIGVSEAPVFASHSGVRSLCDVPRNMTDEMIKALAKKGGVIQVNFYSAFLDEAFKRKSGETREQLKPQIKKLRETYKDDRGAFWSEIGKLWKKHGPEPPGIDVLIDHIDHVVKLAGVDYVGLGSDYDGAGSFPKGLEDVTGYPLITYHLLKRGYKEEDIKKILGGNFLRFFEEVIRAAGKNGAR
jgi:membrane dipeptidase